MSATRTFTVTGMSCGHCENAVRQEVGDLAGVTDVTVSAAEGHLSVTVGDTVQVTDGAIVAAVDEAGYEAVRS